MIIATSQSLADGKEIRSCNGCKWYLGGNICQIGEAGECREGGGYELYELKEEAE